MAAPNFVVICSVTDANRQKEVHKRIKTLSRKWWHHVDNVWIVESDLPISEFRRKASEDLETTDSLLVLALKATSGSRWSQRGFDSSWFRKAFTKPE
ncbi:hypothetical protein AB0O58_21080 [Rhodococcus sp. NPDC080181]|uniref:hypothetical protein n=1 Tax=Rhodococcus sp. NPDC080181 TaxID=3155292 RepID=UPI0034509246